MNILLFVLIGFILVAGVLFLLTFNLSWQIFVSAQCKTNKQIVTLTFDDGPHPVYTPLILDTLRTANIKAIFFLIGKNVDNFPELARRIANEGHIIGNHSYNHQIKSTFISTRDYEQEILLTDQAILKACGESTTYFRPPFGVTNPNIAKAVKNQRKLVMGWSLRSYDTIYKDQNLLVQKILDKSKPEDILLFHDIELTTKVLPQLIQGLNKKGLL